MKLLLFVLACGALWYFLRAARSKNANGKNPSGDKAETIDLTQCAQCGKWRDAPCRRKGCPLA